MSLSVENLSFGYDKTPVLRELSFTAERGELLAVLGPNGVGKTTLFKCILGLERGYTGVIAVHGGDARAMSRRALAHAVAAIPQVHQLSFRYSVEDMVLMGTSHRVSPLSTPGEAEHAAAREAMERLGIAHLREKSFDRLSGGEQQLVYIARALAQRSGILLMDEPTASLDYGNQLHVLSTVRSLAREGYTVLLSTHNPQHALWFADRALALHEGRRLAWGAPGDVVTPALMETLYGRRARVLTTELGPVLVPELGSEEGAARPEVTSGQ